MTAPTDSEVMVERVIHAPRALVFAAWTNAEHLLRWFAPHGCTITFARLDVRPGGSFHSCIHTPDGHECWCAGRYIEVVAPERLVFTMAVADRTGQLVDPTAVGMDPQWPRETTVRVLLDDIGGGHTRLVLHQSVSAALAQRTGALPSWLKMFDRLEALVAGAL